MAVLFCSVRASAGEIVFDEPSDDRWQYPFNFTPGTRAFASCFGSTSDPNFQTFNDRDGIMIVAWATWDEICPDLPPESYDLREVKVTLTHPEGADWPIDLTPDEWFQFDINGDGMVNADGVPRGDPGDVDGESDDADPGQPLELFGAGFGPFYSLDSWVETSLYVGGDDLAFGPRDPFPFVFEGDPPVERHVEDSVKDGFTPLPWAVGVPVGYTPGNQSSSFPVEFQVDLSLSDGEVRRYFQRQLSAGRVVVVVTSLQLTFEQAPSGFPTFFTKEGASELWAPALSITLVPSGDFDGDGRRAVGDMGAFIECLEGPGAEPHPGKTPTMEQCLCLFDFDEDHDVDLEDFKKFTIGFESGGS